MTIYRQMTIAAFLSLSGFTVLGHAKSCADISSRENSGQYCVEEYERGKCSIFQYTQDSETKEPNFSEGVRKEHLEALKNLPGEAGRIAKIAIGKWFTTDSELSEEESEETSNYRLPNTESCTYLTPLSQALNELESTDQALSCTTPSGKHIYDFNLAAKGRMTWTMSSKIDNSDEYQEWGQQYVTLQATPYSNIKNCDLQIRNLKEKLTICMSRRALKETKFQAKVTSIDLGDYRLKKGSVITLDCEATSAFHEAKIVKQLAGKLDKQLKTTTRIRTEGRRQNQESPANNEISISTRFTNAVNAFLDDKPASDSEAQNK